MSIDPRYQRQALLPSIGEVGQRRLDESAALVVGCGALGSVAAELLARAGVGRLVIVDRDVVELTNLHRQVLFDESDAAEALPKAEAARRKLVTINSAIEVDSQVADFTAANADALAEGCGVVVDGTDNFETRYLLNDLAVKRSLPYVYGGAVGTHGTVQSVLPRSLGGRAPWERAGVSGPCLRCVAGGEASGAGGASCDTVGVLGPVTAMIASLQAAEAIKLLVGDYAAVSPCLRAFDLWTNDVRRMDVRGMVDPECPCCGHRRFEYLEGRAGASATALCGRNAVQVSPSGSGRSVDFESVGERLAAVGEVAYNRFTLKARIEAGGRSHEITLFADGRAIVGDTEDPALARSLYSRYIGL
jgi:adenylyltransferase/sulfurtransferase